MVVFFDIDGTLIDEPTQTIPASAVRAVHAMQENGHIAVINTGRPYSHVDERLREMDFRGWIGGCGMEVMLDGQWLYHALPSRDLQVYAVETSRKYRMRPAYEADGGVIYLDGDYSNNPFIQWDVDQLRTKGFIFRQLADCPDWSFIKFIAFIDDDSDVAGFTEAMSPYFEVIVRGKLMVELVLKGNSKARGMQYVLDALGISKDEALAVGDSTNDLPMFELAGHTVCMGNGMDEVKAVAEYVTDSVMEDGVEKALRHYGLIT